MTNFYAYLEGFSYGRVGFSSAIIVVMLIVTFGMSYAILTTLGREVDVE